MVGFKNQLIKYRKCLDGNNVDSVVDDNATIVLEFETGQQAIVRSSWNVSRPDDYFIIRGRQGDLLVDCWKKEILLQRKTVPDISHRTIILNKEKVYQVESENSNPESLKLDAFLSHIESGKGNLKEIAYAMEILFSCLSSKGIPEIPEYIYSPRDCIANMSIGSSYI